jgi:multidrug resistance efflux pump
MLGELGSIRRETLVAMALAILDVGRKLTMQEIAELEQIQRELQRRRHLGQQRVAPVADQDQALTGCGRR